jgi:hypothetical protein
MGKTIGLKQLSQKKYDLVDGLDETIAYCIGVVESAWDCIIYGASGNGKSNFTAIMLKALIKALQCKCEYVAYEEGHAMTIQETFIGRHNMLEELGNVLQITDHLTYAELDTKMARKQSAKIWVIDSLQAAHFTEEQCADLKRKYVLSRKKKIIIYISWSDGKTPKGAAAKSVEYYANIKLRVEGLVVFPKTRYEKGGIGNKRYVIHEKGARDYWGEDYDKVVHGKQKTRHKTKIKKPPKEPEPEKPLAPTLFP